MKKIIIAMLAAAMCLSFAACGSNNTSASNEPTKQSTVPTETPKPKPKTAEEYANALKDAELPIGQIQVWTEETDPNQKLGRPNEYTSKIDFEDTSLEQGLTEYLNGGTIEVFAAKKDCQARYDYLSNFTDPSLGAMGLNQYMYKGDLVILRVSYDVVPDEAKNYEAAFNELIK